MIPLDKLELILKKFQPNVDLSQALASLTADLPSSNPTQITPSQPISQPLHIDTPIAEGGEGGDEWFDAVAGLEKPMGETEEEVYSGATIPLGDDDDADEKDDAGSKPVGEEKSVPVEAEPVTVEAQSIPREEQLMPTRRREVEQVAEHQPMVEEGAQEGLDGEGMGDIRMPVNEGKLDMEEDVVVVTDSEEEVRKEQSKEDFGQGVSGHEEGPPTNVVGAPVRRRRLLIDEASEEEGEDVIFQPIGGLFDYPIRETVTEGDREQRKRKGKEMANPAKKMLKQPSMAVVIQEPNPDVGRTGREEDSDEDEALWWEQRSKKRNDETQSRPRKNLEEARPQYKKFLIRLDRRLLSRMVKFNDPKRDDECERRVTGNKTVKSGKKLHQPSLQKLDGEEKFLEFITGIGFEWLLDIDMPAMPVALAQEFFTTFRFKATTDLEEESISFRICKREMRMSLTEWSVRLGLYTVDQAVEGDWFGRDIGMPKNNPEFDPQRAWRSIVHKRAPAYKPTVSRANHIEDPILRLAQVFLGYNLLGQANTSSTITLAELYFMWCMKEQRKVHLGYWIAHACHTIATHSVRHLNICHLLGAFVKNNLVLEMEDGVPTPPLCPEPELFDMKFFINVKVVMRRNRKLHFYDVGQPELPVARSAVTKEAEQTEGRLALTPRTTDEGADTAPEADWKKRMENLLLQLVQNTEIQAAQMTRAVEVMEQMLAVVREGQPRGEAGESSRPRRH